MPGRAFRRYICYIPAAFVGMVFACSPGAMAQSDSLLAIKAGRIVTVSGPEIVNGTILINHGKIVAVGTSEAVKVPSGYRIVDARANVVVPGLVAAYSTLAGFADSPESISPDVRATDGFDFYTNYSRLLKGGLTSTYLSTSSKRLISGQGGVVKLAGDSAAARTLAVSADIRVSLGAPSKSPPAIFRPSIPPTTDNPLLPAQRPLQSVRPAQFALLRQIFADARVEASLHSSTSQQGFAAGGASDAGQHMAERRVKLAPFASILSGQRPLRVAANRAADIRLALNFAKEQHIHIVLEGAIEGGRIAQEIAARGVPVIAYASANPGAAITSDFDRDIANGRQRADNIVKLARAGVRVAIMPANEAALNDLLSLAATQVGLGINRDAALRMITSNAAGILGVAGRVGTIESGKDADLLILSGAPLNASSHVDATLVNGKFAYERAGWSADGSPITAIVAARVYTVSHGIIENGVVLIRDGNIVGVNRDGVVPAGARVVDASHSCVMPGMIDCYSHLGLHADAEPAPTGPASAASGPASGRTRLVNALKSHDPETQAALKSGVTTILLAPLASGSISGTASLVKTTDAPDTVQGPVQRIVKENAAICFNASGGSPRMSQPWQFEELLVGAKAYNVRRIQYLRDLKRWEHDRDEAKRLKKDPPAEPGEVAKDEDQDPLASMFRGEVPAFVHASRYDEIMMVLKTFRDLNDLSVTLVGCSDGYRVADELRKRGVDVALGPDMVVQDHGKTFNMGAELCGAGVHVMLQSDSSSGTQFLRLNAANAVRSGMEPADALRSVTLTPATALHVQDRLGSIDAGKDADLVILNGDPMELTSRVERVLVNGRVVYEDGAK